MRARYLSPATVALAVAACGGGPPAPVALAYGLPDPAALTYLSGDTLGIEVDAGGQSFELTQSSSATYDAAFSRSEDGVQVTLTVPEFSGRMSQPMGAPVTADEGDIRGALVFTLDRLGDATLVSQPEVADQAATFFGGRALAYSFFPGLPGRPVVVGDTWTDTVRFSGPQGPGEVSTVTVLTYTVTRDTVLAGRSVVRLDVAGTTEQSASGAIAGMSFDQSVRGDLEGFVLWDLTRAVMVERYAEADMRGTMNVSAAPFPLNIRVRGRNRARLRN